MSHVIIYTRVSTEDQGDSGLGLEAQRVKCDQFARFMDLAVSEVVIEVATTKTDNPHVIQRPLLRAALEKLGPGDGLLILRLDRLCRCVAEWQTLLTGWFCERKGVRLYSAMDLINTGDAMGRMVLNIRMAVAQAEREVTGERTKAALTVLRDRGCRVGAVRYGYKLAADGVTLVEDAAEQAVIARARELRRDGVTLRGIVAILHEEGHRARAGAAFHPASVRRMFASNRDRVSV